MNHQESSVFPREWETISVREDDSATLRLMVPGGWLVRYVKTPPPFINSNASVALTFVPDPDHAWVLP